MTLHQHEHFVSAEHQISSPLLNEHSVRHRALLEGKPNSMLQLDKYSSKQLRSTTRRIQSPETIPTYQDHGAYFVDIYVGSPPQRQTLMIDTGSERTALPCKQCDKCGDGHTDMPFDQSLSQTFRELRCGDCLSGTCNAEIDKCATTAKYAEGSSWRGLEVLDYIYPGGPNNKVLDVNKKLDDNDDAYSGLTPTNAAKYRFPLKFTCMESNEGAFKEQKADGIMGLNLKKGSFWNQMYDEGAIASRQFSMCLRKHPYTPLDSEAISVGAMTWGGVDDRLNTSDMKFFDFEDTKLMPSMFGLRIRKIHVHKGGGQRLRDLGEIRLVTDNIEMMNKDGVILDSGTTDTILPPALKPLIDAAWEDMLGIPFPTEPVSLLSNELKTWPTIVLQLTGSTDGNMFQHGSSPVSDGERNDVLVAFPPSSYMGLNLATKQYTPRITMDEKYGSR